MKPLLQRLPVEEQTSFVARTYTTPLFETSWHKHREIELVLHLAGNGMCFIGNYIGDFKAGDIFLLGPNLPHEFKKEREDMECSVMVIHFEKDFLGEDFWKIPESKEITQLLDQSMAAIKVANMFNTELADSIRGLEFAAGFERITRLCHSLLLLSRSNNRKTLSTHPVKELNFASDDKINKVFEYTIKNFQNPISLATVAGLANLSIPAFCRYFKRNTKKTYIDFLNEMRVGYICEALIATDKNISEISYANGFSTLANFNKQFFKIKGLKPSIYKKNYKANLDR